MPVQLIPAHSHRLDHGLEPISTLLGAAMAGDLGYPNRAQRWTGGSSAQDTQAGWENGGILQRSPPFGMQHVSLGRVCDAGISVMSSDTALAEAELSELPEATVITQARSDCIHLEYELRTTR